MKAASRNPSGTHQQIINQVQEIPAPARRVGRPNLSGRDYSSYIPGGKNANGTIENIINLVPPHTTKLELYAGSAPLTRTIRPCVKTVVVEIDTKFTSRYRLDGIPGVIVLNEDAIEFLKSFQIFEAACYDPIAKKELSPEQVFIYCDPPYPKATRRSPGKKLFKFDYETKDHKRLLELLVTLRFKIAISSYRNPLYDDLLKGWNRFDFKSHTNKGVAIESVYYNYDLSKGELHDYLYVGKGTRKRTRIKSLGATIIRRLKSLEPVERNAILFRISESFTSKISEI